MNVGIIGCGWLGLPLAITLKNKGLNIFGTCTQLAKCEQLKEQGIVASLYNGDPSSEIPSWIGDLHALILNFPPSKSFDYPTQIKTMLQYVAVDCHVVFTSSTGVYLNNEHPIDEMGAVEASHVVYLAELMVRENAKHWTILRLAGLIAEDRNPAKYLSNRPCPNPDGVVNLVHRKDVIRAIEQVIAQKAFGKTYNVCSPEHPTRRDYYLKMTAQLGIPPPIFSATNEKGKCIDGQLITRELNINYLENVY
jgi:hypothetical protein